MGFWSKFLSGAGKVAGAVASSAPAAANSSTPAGASLSFGQAVGQAAAVAAGQAIAAGLSHESAPAVIVPIPAVGGQVVTRLAPPVVSMQIDVAPGAQLQDALRSAHLMAGLLSCRVCFIFDNHRFSVAPDGTIGHDL